MKGFFKELGAKIEELIVGSKEEKISEASRLFINKIFQITRNCIPKLSSNEDILITAFNYLNGENGRYISEAEVLKKTASMIITDPIKAIQYNRLLSIVVQYGTVDQVHQMLTRFPRLIDSGNISYMIFTASKNCSLPKVHLLMTYVHRLLQKNVELDREQFMKDLRKFVSIAVSGGDHYIARYVANSLATNYKQDDLLFTGNGYELYHFMTNQFTPKICFGFSEVVDITFHVMMYKWRLSPARCASKAWNALKFIEIEELSNIILSFLLFGQRLDIDIKKALSLPKFFEKAAEPEVDTNFDKIIVAQCQSVIENIVNNPEEESKHLMPQSTADAHRENSTSKDRRNDLEKYYYKFPQTVVLQCLDTLKAQGKEVSQELSNTILSKLSVVDDSLKFTLGSKVWINILESLTTKETQPQKTISN